MADKVAEALLAVWNDVKTKRMTFESDWQDIVDLVRANSSDIRTKKTPGESRVDDIYDSTAPNANLELASGLHSFLTNPSERWFNIDAVNVPTEELDDATLLWLEVVSDAIYSQYQNPNVNFNVSMHESYLDIGAFGTCCPYQEWNAEGGHLTFRTFPMADCYFRENAYGRIDSVFRTIEWTGRQASQEFADIPRDTARAIQAKPDATLSFLHMVLPRTDKIPGVQSKSQPYASYWLCLTTKEIMAEGGYLELPYHPARWLKLANEVYGRGPASTCLPDIRVLNVMEKLMLKAGAKAIDPPLQVPDEGFALPITTQASSLIWKEPDAPNIEPLVHKGNLPFGLEQSDRKREQIKMSFHSDWLRLEKMNKEMTAFEVQDRRNEKLSLLAPMLGRIQSEKLGPLVARSFRLLASRGLIPPAPPMARQLRLAVVYASPASRAQTASKATEMTRYVQELIPLMQLRPEVADALDFDVYARKLAEWRGSPRAMIRPIEAVMQIRAQREQQQQMAALVEGAGPASQAVKNIAQANELTGGSIFPV